MELVTGAMGSLLPKLGQLLKEEYKLQTDVRKQVQSLTRELEMMHAALRKVAEVPPQQVDELVKLWARDVRELSYDMEDILDDFLVRVGDDDGAPDAKAKKQSRKERFMKTMGKMGELFTKGKARHQIADAIKEIKEQLQQVADTRGKYTVDSIMAKPAATPSTIDPRIFALYKDVMQLVGVEGPRDKIIKMLSEGEDAPNKITKAISIVGIGGLGKTTLAKAVYDKLKVGFDCCAFVPVGLNPSRTKVLKDLLIDLGIKNSDLEGLDTRQLINKLRDFLENKRYFIVIDDIWDKESWEVIRCAFTDNSHGNKVVVTTRKSGVGTHVGKVYELRPLSRENSIKLFHTRLGVCEDECSPNQPNNALYDKFYQKCGGVPLAIITIASLLASKPREVWSKVYDFIGFGHGGNLDAENTRRILSYSYYDLPCHLRTCLLYVAMFPEDYFIYKHRLIWMWIAEGFIHGEKGEGLFEAGERCFNELINRSMIKLEGDESFGMTGFRVHDMVLDLVRSLSREENFMTIQDKESGAVTIEHSKLSRIRRVAIHHNNILDPNPHGKRHVRSFAAFECHGSSPSFRGLRVLHMEGCVFTGSGSEDLVHLGDLFHLRYLGLVNTKIHELPKEIGKLELLQTLVLAHTGIVEELPSSVGLLRQLLCLHASCYAPYWIGNLTFLHELNISFERNDDMLIRLIKELQKLSDLEVLIARIHYLGDKRWARALLETLLLLSNLRHVEILDGGPFFSRIGAASALAAPAGRHLRYLKLGLFLRTMPEWINPSILPYLSHLEVYVKIVRDEDMKALGRMPELRYLGMYHCQNPFVCCMGMAAGGGGGDWVSYFQKLRVFYVSFDFRIRGQPVNGGGSAGECSRFVVVLPMPRLEKVEFYVHVRFLKEAGIGFPSLESSSFPSLQYAKVKIDCQYARLAEVEKAEEALRQAAADHPNHPTLHVEKINRTDMLSFDQDQLPALYRCKAVDLTVRVREEDDKTESQYEDMFRLLHNPHIEEVTVSISCEDATAEEVEEAEELVRTIVGTLHNHPTLQMARCNQDKMK